MRKSLENGVEALIFGCRWVQVPAYLGLIFASLLYTYKYLLQVYDMARSVHESSEEELMLQVLTLIDVTMVLNLLVMVIIGGYATFVSKLSMTYHEDHPDWLDHINAATLKIKLTSSLVAITGIHLLKSFMHLKEEHDAGMKDDLMWELIVHGTFLGTVLALSWSERILGHFDPTGQEHGTQGGPLPVEDEHKEPAGQSH